MAKRFTKRHTADGYAAMGGSLKRPRISGANASKGDVKAAIERERMKAARMAKASKKKG